MEKGIKEILSKYVKIDADKIFDTTEISIPGSILIHRLYGEIQRYCNINLSVREIMQIKTYSDLRKKIDINDEFSSSSHDPKNEIMHASPNTFESKNLEMDISIGIDIEKTSSMPVVDDFRNHSFYEKNFSQEEISYCIMQPEPYASLAGKFAAKEAIIKSDNNFSKMPLKNIEILNDQVGKPYFQDYLISISHTDEIACAIAIRKIKSVSENPQKLAYSNFEEREKGNFSHRKLPNLVFALVFFQLILFFLYLERFLQ